MVMCSYTFPFLIDSYPRQASVSNRKDGKNAEGHKEINNNKEARLLHGQWGINGKGCKADQG